MKQDVMLDNGGIVFNPNNSDEKRLGGSQAIIQRIKIALSLKKGNFIYDKDAGLEIPDLDYTKERNLKILEMLINEIVSKIGSCKAKLISLDTANMVANMLFVFKDNSYRTEVKLYG
ncbi:MAG: hypothetical protein J1F17_02200 [Oscillospiraceae bacterium]|nr:hypothetical protein [Oscillospiraceae bacterium]